MSPTARDGNAFFFLARQDEHGDDVFAVGERKTDARLPVVDGYHGVERFAIDVIGAVERGVAEDQVEHQLLAQVLRHHGVVEELAHEAGGQRIDR